MKAVEVAFSAVRGMFDTGDVPVVGETVCGGVNRRFHHIKDDVVVEDVMGRLPASVSAGVRRILWCVEHVRLFHWVQCPPILKLKINWWRSSCSSNFLQKLSCNLRAQALN